MWLTASTRSIRTGTSCIISGRGAARILPGSRSGSRWPLRDPDKNGRRSANQRAGFRRCCADGIELASGEFIPAELTVWAAGVKGTGRSSQSRRARGQPRQSARDRVTLNDARPRHFAIGDCAAGPARGLRRARPAPRPGRPSGSLASGKTAERRLQGLPLEPFVYRDFGSLVSFGRMGAIGNLMNLALGATSSSKACWRDGCIGRSTRCTSGRCTGDEDRAWHTRPRPLPPGGAEGQASRGGNWRRLEGGVARSVSDEAIQGAQGPPRGASAAHHTSAYVYVRICPLLLLFVPPWAGWAGPEACPPGANCRSYGVDRCGQGIGGAWRRWRTAPLKASWPGLSHSAMTARVRRTNSKPVDQQITP